MRSIQRKGVKLPAPKYIQIFLYAPRQLCVSTRAFRQATLELFRSSQRINEVLTSEGLHLN